MYEKGQYIVYGIRGVCQVADIITIDHPVGPKGRLYYELHPYNQYCGYGGYLLFYASDQRNDRGK